MPWGMRPAAVGPHGIPRHGVVFWADSGLSRSAVGGALAGRGVGLFAKPSSPAAAELDGTADRASCRSCRQ